jgi:hypothetical protein
MCRGALLFAAVVVLVTAAASASDNRVMCAVYASPDNVPVEPVDALRNYSSIQDAVDAMDGTAPACLVMYAIGQFDFRHTVLVIDRRSTLTFEGLAFRVGGKGSVLNTALSFSTMCNDLLGNTDFTCMAPAAIYISNSVRVTVRGLNVWATVHLENGWALSQAPYDVFRVVNCSDSTLEFVDARVTAVLAATGVPHVGRRPTKPAGAAFHLLPAPDAQPLSQYFSDMEGANNLRRNNNVLSTCTARIEFTIQDVAAVATAEADDSLFGAVRGVFQTALAIRLCTFTALWPEAALLPLSGRGAVTAGSLDLVACLRSELSSNALVGASLIVTTPSWGSVFSRNMVSPAAMFGAVIFREQQFYIYSSAAQRARLEGSVGDTLQDTRVADVGDGATAFRFESQMRCFTLQHSVVHLSHFGGTAFLVAGAFENVRIITSTVHAVLPNMTGTVGADQQLDGVPTVLSMDDSFRFYPRVTNYYVAVNQSRAEQCPFPLGGVCDNRPYLVRCMDVNKGPLGPPTAAPNGTQPAGGGDSAAAGVVVERALAIAAAVLAVVIAVLVVVWRRLLSRSHARLHPAAHDAADPTDEQRLMSLEAQFYDDAEFGPRSRFVPPRYRGAAVHSAHVEEHEAMDTVNADVGASVFTDGASLPYDLTHVVGPVAAAVVDFTQQPTSYATMNSSDFNSTMHEPEPEHDDDGATMLSPASRGATVHFSMADDGAGAAPGATAATMASMAATSHEAQSFATINSDDFGGDEFGGNSTYEA